ncbi:MAG: NAD-dependent epimerase/dehydratase family protein, partial [Lutibacter sp.]
MGNLSTYDGIASHVLKSVDLSPLANKTVMVTGASGLLGSHIVNILTKAAPIYNLHIMAVVQTRLHPEQEPFDRLQVAYANLGNPADCERLPFADVVISAASYAQPKRFLAAPIGALRSSGLGIMALLE